MDQVSTVVAALLAGAASGLTSTATSAVKDAYAGLKKLVQRAFADNPDAEQALRKAEEKPKAYGPALEEEVRASGIADNPEIRAAAEQLLEQLKHAGIATNSFTVNTHDNSQVGAVGPNANVTMVNNKTPTT
jgi:predicted deacylase